MNSAASGSEIACDLRKRGVVQNLAGRVHLLHTPMLQHEPARNGPQVNGGAKRVSGMLNVMSNVDRWTSIPCATGATSQESHTDVPRLLDMVLYDCRRVMW